MCVVCSMLRNTSLKLTVSRMPSTCTIWPASGKKLIGLVQDIYCCLSILWHVLSCSALYSAALVTITAMTTHRMSRHSCQDLLQYSFYFKFLFFCDLLIHILATLVDSLVLRSWYGMLFLQCMQFYIWMVLLFAFVYFCSWRQPVWIMKK